jgi:hypothetical protein
MKFDAFPGEKTILSYKLANGAGVGFEPTLQWRVSPANPFFFKSINKKPSRR